MPETSPPQLPSRPAGRLRRSLLTLQQCLSAWAFGIQMRRQIVYTALARPLQGCVSLLVLGSLATIVAEYGFTLLAPTVALVHTMQHSIVWSFLAVFVLRLGLTLHLGRFVKQHALQTVLMLLVLADLLAMHTATGSQWLTPFLRRVEVKQIVLFYVAFVQGVILFIDVFTNVYYRRAMAMWQIRPAQTLVLSFFGLIVLGSLSLMLPTATIHAGTMPFLHALFTATSAVCVTGLIVVDTATYFTPLGQGIILGLCQLGGLGIITFATVIGMMVRGGPGIQERIVLQDFIRSQRFGEISATTRRIVGLTLLLEALGAVSLYVNWQEVIPEAGPRLWHAVFHAVSAFCNAGFSTFSHSLAAPGTAMHLGGNVTVMLLIVLGGLGFVVLWEGWQWITGVMRGHRPRLSVQSRLVGFSTVWLIVCGAVAFAFMESTGVLAGRPLSEQFLGSLFQSITARTAGFNTLAIESLTMPAALLLILLMLIGAAPGSTGGGLKTTTVAVLLMSTVATFRGKARVELSRRTLPWNVINQAYATFFFAIAVITLSLFVLSITETHPFLDLFFEEVSAFATVGLSRGITPLLSSTGKLVIIISMFIGRVGGLTLGVALARQVSTTAYAYPEESVMVG